jgi:hypothetical protein
MRIPHSIKGTLSMPVIVSLLFLLKSFCTAASGNMCVPDYFATFLFLPLVGIYKMFGYTLEATYEEFIFILIYWASIGFLIGFVLDILYQKDEATTPLAAQAGSVPSNPTPTPTPTPSPLAAPLPPSIASAVPPAHPVSTPPVLQIGGYVSVPVPKKAPLNLLDRAEYK